MLVSFLFLFWSEMTHQAAAAAKKLGADLELDLTGTRAAQQESCQTENSLPPPRKVPAQAHPPPPGSYAEDGDAGEIHELQQELNTPLEEHRKDAVKKVPHRTQTTRPLGFR